MASLALLACVVGRQWLVRDARVGTREASQFLVPSGSPDENMRAGATFAKELDPGVEISYRDAQSGTLSMSRVEGDRIKCVLRVSPDTQEALKPLDRFLKDRINQGAQAMFAMSHEIGHCKLRDAFLQRSDGRAADASVFPWVAQEAAADVYGILSVERRLGEGVAVRQAVITARTLGAAVYHDAPHATGYYISHALALCRQNRTDLDAVHCAISTAYYTVGSLSNAEQGAPLAVDAPPERVYQLGVRKIASAMRLYDGIRQYKARFSGSDLRRFTFNQISRRGDSRYITAENDRRTDITYRLADFYGFKTGELVTRDQRNVTALRIDGADELDWLLTLGAVVRTEDGAALRKGG
ncbi:MAG TPA: hypothetical protein VGM15_13735 [Burkholderiaceae bacterium]